MQAAQLVVDPGVWHTSQPGTISEQLRHCRGRMLARKKGEQTQFCPTLLKVAAQVVQVVVEPQTLQSVLQAVVVSMALTKYPVIAAVQMIGTGAEAE